jgi:hypothetical protein
MAVTYDRHVQRSPYCPSKGYRKLVVQMIPIFAPGPIEREIIFCVAYNIVGIGVISIHVGDHILSVCLTTLCRIIVNGKTYEKH